MSKSWVMGALVGGGVVLGGLAVGAYTTMKAHQAASTTPDTAAQYAQRSPDGAASTGQGPASGLFAQVLKVTPVKEQIEKPVEECHDVEVQHTRPPKDTNRVAGTVIGGLLGGVLGHQVGNGRGKDLATAAGAVAGGYAGNEAQQNMQEGDKYMTTESRCSTVTHTSSKVVGYDVKYLINGETRTERRDQKPKGDRIPVQDGHLLWSEAHS